MKMRQEVGMKLAKFVNYQLSKYNLALIRKNADIYSSSNVVDLRECDQYIQPSEILSFSSNLHLKYLLDVPVERIISKRILKVRIETLKIRVIEKDHLRQEERDSYKYFQEHFKNFQPRTVAERLEIPERFISQNNNTFFNQDPLFAVYPWDVRSPEYLYNRRLKTMKKETKEFGGFTYDISDGFKTFGPASSRLIWLEYNRLIRVFQSIKKNGYMEEYGYPSASIYINDGSWLMELHGFSHRTPAFLVSESNTMPVLFSEKYTNVVKRSEVEEWPHVISGLFSEELALYLFDEKFRPLLDTEEPEK